jgi:exopolysaccharide biosynthesis polyprenyl glycosylphosphotransferase
VAWVGLAAAHDLYHLRSRRLEQDIGEESQSVLQMTMWWSWSLLIAAEIFSLESVTVPTVALSWGIALVLVLLLRVAAREVARTRSWYVHRTLLIGSPLETRSLRSKMERHPEYGLEVVGCVDAAAAAPARRNGGPPSVVRFQDVPDLVAELGVHRVILAGAPRSETGAPRFSLARELAELGVRVDLLPAWFEMLGARLETSEIEGTSLLTVPYVQLGRGSAYVKRTFDLVVSATLIVAMLPLFLACAIAIKRDSRGPVLFRQPRVGRDGEHFELLKFRSMSIDADERKHTVADLNLHRGGGAYSMFKVRRDPRVTRVGALLRRASLDELPQLWNILRGDMSLVGPRPLIETEARQVQGLYRRRLELTPGLTGLWQVNGRSEVPFDAMVNLDYLYVTTWSLWGDVKILLRTIPAVLARRGAY